VRKWAALALACVVAVFVSGCAEPTQKEAQDSQAEINKKMKEKGENKDAY